jgi:DNA-directed RNA polymerase specialized sigma24 family protein
LSGTGAGPAILVDERLAEDVVPEAFLAYWRNPDAFDEALGSFGSWFLALVHHEAVDVVRHETAQRTGAPLGTVKTRMLTGMRRLHDGPSAVAPTLAVLPGGAAPVAAG